MTTFVELVIKHFLSSNKEIVPEAPDAEFVSFDQESGSQPFTCNSDIHFGRINYKLPNGQLKKSTNLFIKTVKTDGSFYPQLQASFFTNESFFYTKMMPYFASVADHLGMSPVHQLFPKFYGCQMSFDVANGTPQSQCHHDRAAMVFQNLQFLGYKQSARKCYLDFDHLALMLRKLGQLHSYSYAARAQSPEVARIFPILADSFTRIPFQPLFSLTPLVRWHLNLLRQRHPEIGSKLEVEFENVEDKYLNLLMRNDGANPLAVLCHGDFTSGNVLFKYDEHGKPVDLKMIDMANCRLSTPATDLCNVFTFHCDQKMKDDRWNDLMQEYVQGLSSTFPDSVPPAEVQLPTIQQILDQFKNGAASLAFLHAFTYFPILLAHDYDLSLKDLVPAEYSATNLALWPKEVYLEVSSKIGGEMGTTAIVEILLDMFRRKYIG